MRLGAVSDIHLDINLPQVGDDFLIELILTLDSLKLDALIIPGDIAANLSMIKKFFLSVNELKIPLKLFVPGNHDIWSNPKSFDGSKQKYNLALPALCRANDWHFLPRNPLVIDEVAFIGTTGWYDYSTRDKKLDSIFSLEDYIRKVNPNKSMWMDRKYVRWGKTTDVELAKIFHEELVEDLAKIGVKSVPGIAPVDNSQTREIKKIVYASHIVPYEAFIRRTLNINYAFFSAYIGNNQLGEVLDTIANKFEVHAFFGHTHFPKRAKMKSGVNGYCVPVGYPDEYGLDRPILEVFKERIAVIEL